MHHLSHMPRFSLLPLSTTWVKDLRDARRGPSASRPGAAGEAGGQVGDAVGAAHGADGGGEAVAVADALSVGFLAHSQGPEHRDR